MSGPDEQGLTAMLRVKDEADLLEETIMDILPYFDRIVICIQPSLDDTGKISLKLADNHRKIKAFFYDYESLANGPGYLNQDPHSLYSRTYFYNWCLSKVTTTRVCKWDADMRFIDEERARYFVNTKSKYVVVHGNECKSFDDLTERPMDRMYTAAEVRIFPLRNSYFLNGELCEQLNYYQTRFYKKVPNFINTKTLKEPVFNHFKYARSVEHVTKSWPEGWQEIEHFRKLYEQTK